MTSPAVAGRVNTDLFQARHRCGPSGEKHVANQRHTSRVSRYLTWRGARARDAALVRSPHSACVGLVQAFSAVLWSRAASVSVDVGGRRVCPRCFFQQAGQRRGPRAKLCIAARNVVIAGRRGSRVVGHGLRHAHARGATCGPLSTYSVCWIGASTFNGAMVNGMIWVALTSPVVAGRVNTDLLQARHRCGPSGQKACCISKAHVVGWWGPVSTCRLCGVGTGACSEW